jgi:hypothetical protein
VDLVAAPLLDSGQTTEDCELAVARAVRLAAMRRRYPTFRERRPLLSPYVRAAASEDNPIHANERAPEIKTICASVASCRHFLTLAPPVHAALTIPRGNYLPEVSLRRRSRAPGLTRSIFILRYLLDFYSRKWNPVFAI